MLKRPSPHEGEEDILRMQEEYLREKNKDANLRPAAQVTNLRSQASAENLKPPASKFPKTSTRKPSKYAQCKGLKNEKTVRFESSTGFVMGDILEKNVQEETTETEIDDDKVYYPKIIPSVMSNIVERNTNVNLDIGFTSMPEKGFPVAVKCDVTIASGSKSIHALYVEQNRLEKSVEMEVDQSSSNNMTIDSEQQLTNLPNKSYIVKSHDADVIHSENVNLLSKMSQNEILEEQQKLLTDLDPNLIKFLKSKRKNDITNPMDNKNPKNQKLTNTDERKVSDSNELYENDILSHPNVNQWLHFDSLEKDKLEWMKGIEESNTITPDKPYEARFDFKGYLLPYTIPYTEETKSLFHHGDEPHRPGYTLTELFELTRSTISQQRVFALTTIAGILEYYTAGTYEGVIEIPLSKILFVIRFALDDKAEAILEASLKALRNLVYNKIDEASLDALLGFEAGTQQPCLENDKSEIEELESKESELKDYHLAEVDIIAALLRTDILTRIQYILQNINANVNCIQYSLQILTRLARDSPETSMKIVEKEYLMNSIKEVVSKYNIQPMQIPAMRLIRILSLQTKEIGEILLKKYSFLDPVMQHISTVANTTNALRIQIEAFCVMSNLLQYKLAIEEAISMFPIILSTLYTHIQNTDVFVNTSVLNATHAAVVLQFASKILRNTVVLDSNKEQLYILLREGARKWLAQVSMCESYTCGHLRLVCSILDCCKTIILVDQIELGFLKDSLTKLTNSSGFLKIISHLEACSNLLSGIEIKNLHFTKNLMTLGSSVVEAQLKTLPILNTVSPVPFLASLFKVLELFNDANILLSFVEKLEPYIEKLAAKLPSLSDNWFTRTETDLVTSIIKVAVKIDIPESKKDLLYSVANKLCYILRADKREELEFMFNNIVFNKQWFTAERLMNLVSLSDADGFSKALTSIEEIKLCYSTVVNLNYRDTGANIVLRKWQEPILPRDWMYLPILNLYSRSQEPAAPRIIGAHVIETKEQTAVKEFIIRSSLEWILFNEYCFPDLLKDINVTDRFCRLMCVFLCDNSLFLDPKIKILLQKCTKILFRKSNEFNFDHQLTGLSNFQGFYTQFLEQFQSVSYGDYTFAACVLVPLAQRHDVKWRKLIWSEYAGCLRALDCPEDRLCYQLNDYLYPDETDASLIKSYHRALTSNLVRPDTIAYAIAHHHVERNRQKTA
ncbi:hypothetical protein MSG28_005548 [Choristoneura fumiferana]|uniref:Uncharacterized protein n=1 Tax=Choristoneura fumiferana TaxID=7141 RepID=A0ACC0KZT0_CHOFU|nr:hypothetical protein MSG28_005548 [Choristoneura fumiferana]